MRWWAWAWVSVLLLAAVGGAWDDWVEARPAWYALLGLASGVWCATAAAAHFSPRLREQLGRTLLAGSILALVWLSLSWIREISATKSDPELTAMENAAVALVAVVLVAVLFGPALFLGIRDGFRQWRKGNDATSVARRA